MRDAKMFAPYIKRSHLQKRCFIELAISAERLRQFDQCARYLEMHAPKLMLSNSNAPLALAVPLGRIGHVRSAVLLATKLPSLVARSLHPIPA
jgi:hypothetical protein